MCALRVSKNMNYDDFREESEILWPTYLRVAERIIRELTADDLRGAAVHPDGFLKMPIGPQNWVADGQVRLHFWLPERKATRQPHGHPWHLASMVLAGAYREYLPDLRPDGSGDLRKFFVTYPPGVDARTGVRRVGDEWYRNEPGPLYETRPGDTHCLPAGPVHMSSPDAGGAITLTVMSPRFADEAYFYAPDSTPFSESVTRDDLAAIMEVVAAVRGDL
jgi:hypothetical protein